jgi:hypothetical protein
MMIGDTPDPLFAKPWRSEVLQQGYRRCYSISKSSYNVLVVIDPTFRSKAPVGLQCHPPEAARIHRHLDSPLLKLSPSPPQSRKPRLPGNFGKGANSFVPWRGATIERQGSRRI